MSSVFGHKEFELSMRHPVGVAGRPLNNNNNPDISGRHWGENIPSGVSISTDDSG